MDTFLKAIGGILIALVFYLILAKQGKDISVLLTLSVGIMIVSAATVYIKPIISLISQLRETGNLDTQMLGILCKVVGISLLSEFVGQVCADAGNNTMGKTVKILSNSMVLWLSLPLFSKLIELIKEILVAI